MRFASLGSGSRGNATLVEAGPTIIMVDCGFSIAETERRLARLHTLAADISAILVTHEHSDHVSGVARFARRHSIPVWCTAGTLAACTKPGLDEVHIIDGRDAFSIGDLGITPVTVPHDAREPVQFVFSDGGSRFGLLTDTGSITPHILKLFDACAALMLECNHDRRMLEDSAYPATLKARVGGPLGHLSNAQAAEFLRELDQSRLQYVAAAHLSEKNNTPALAQAALADAAGCELDWIAVVDQEQGLNWCALA